MQRLYLDTSIYGGFFEPEFEIWTNILFNKISKSQYKVVFSKLTDIELERAPQNVKDLVNSLPPDVFEFVDISEDSLRLADQYLDEKVVGKTNRADCIHIALATLNNVDILVSWNFKHIVNIHRIRGYNSVNYKLGYKIIEIRTPREIIEYED
ncbi:MAG: PIN domain protein [Ignavibacteriae bacterium HGW-Ignavibacteriae-1]|jgi:hypothetical protein|nr:MAG: PIN domain protein [Ignavibacteriae bacterium HGW-Ignavibacteriae-1]